MDQPRPEKVATVAEVKSRFSVSDTVLFTEYRGLDVPALAELRRALRDAGGEYKVYKNTLVRLAARQAGHEIDDLLVGPTAIAFVSEKADGTPGDGAAAAKVLRDFSKKNDALVLKGGLLGDKLLDETQVKALADLPSREELLARIAGGFAAPMQKFAALLKAMPQNLAYGIKAVIDAKPAEAAAPAEAPTESAPADEPEAAPAQDAESATSTEGTQADEASETNQADEAASDQEN